MTAIKKLAFIVLIAMLTLFTACGDSEDDNDNNHTHHHHNNNSGHVSETVHPLGEATSDHGHFVVEAIHDPAAPVAGAAKITLTVTDAHDNNPLDDLTITVIPWMPAHGHGSNKTPVVTAKDAGVYEVTDVVYTMPGDWEVRLAIKDADHEDTLAFGFSVK